MPSAREARGGGQQERRARAGSSTSAAPATRERRERQADEPGSTAPRRSPSRGAQVVAQPAAGEHADGDAEQRQRREPADLRRSKPRARSRYVGSQVR